MDFTNCQMGIYMLPVAEGDCFYIQLPISGDKVFRILIDCGPATSWDKILKPFPQNLERNHLHIDLLITTHLDSDHIAVKRCLIHQSVSPNYELLLNDPVI